jgi:uncharacterized membrane protein YhaH (DUF805 family)
MSIGQMLFSPSGRIRRRDYWLWSIAIILFTDVITLVAHQILTGHSISQYFPDYVKAVMFEDFAPFGIVVLTVVLGLQWPGFCLMAKRWHDRNRSGYFAGGVVAFNWINVLLEAYFAPTETHAYTVLYYGSAVISFGVLVWVFVDCGCLDGTKGPNKYGPSPKQIQAAADVF